MTSAPLRSLALLAGAGLLLTACASPTTSTAAGSAGSTTPAAGSTTDRSAGPAGAGRLALTYDGGLLVLDGATLAVDGNLPLAGFNRVNAAGDGRHVMVSTTAGFQVLDTGTDTAAPRLTDLVFAADAPGHVVRHAGRTVLFADGTGEITAFDTDALDGDTQPETQTTTSLEAHHGVAIELSDGSLLSTLGNADGRTGVRVLDAAGTEITRNEQCPAVHGEGSVEGEVVVFGCKDGALIYRSGAFTKLTAPDAHGRMGNAYVSETSPLVVGDYNSDPDREGYLLDELALIDTAAGTLKVVELPAGVEYTWRDVARGPNDEAVLLSADGTLNTLDPATGAVTASWPVIDAWTGPVEWQDPHPALAVQAGVAYVTEPAKNRVLAVDLTSGAILADTTLPGTPNEITVVGTPTA